MKTMESDRWTVAVETISSGGIIVIPTDTLYGVVTSILHPKSVERLYHIRERNSTKPCIVLLSKKEELRSFVSQEIYETYSKLFSFLWPGPISIALPVEDSRWEHIHRKTKTIAFRVPDNTRLRDFLFRCGPVIAPSANKEGQKVASTINEAKVAFGKDIDFYVDGGTLKGEPSTLISLAEKDILIVRENPKTIKKLIRLLRDFGYNTCRFSQKKNL